jgi:hypothetical protein
MSAKVKLDNLELMPFAIRDLGGISEFVDVEDVFERCFTLSPARFGWRRYSYPNYQTASKALQDFERRYPDYLLKTDDGLRRQLTAEGLRWVQDNEERYTRAFDQPATNPPTRRKGQRLLNNFRDHRLTRTYLAGQQSSLKKHLVADALLCAPDSPSEVWRQRLESLRASAKSADRDELLMFLDYLKSEKPDWFEG